MVIRMEEPADCSRFIDIFKAKDLPGKDMWPRQQSFVWNYDKNTEEAEAERMVEELSRELQRERAAIEEAMALRALLPPEAGTPSAPRKTPKGGK